MIMIITSLLLLFCCQVLALFPSSQGLEVIWSSVVKIGQSLYREGPGKDPFRPDQKTPIKNFFLAGSYTKQVTSTFLFHLRNAWLSNTDYILSLRPRTKKGGWVSTIPALLGREAISACWKNFFWKKIKYRKKPMWGKRERTVIESILKTVYW